MFNLRNLRTQIYIKSNFTTDSAWTPEGLLLHVSLYYK